jgi:hypothetical protein
MDLYSAIISTYPELEIKEGYDPFKDGTIQLKDDGDGVGAYLAEWQFNKPLPKGLTLGKPSA